MEATMAWSKVSVKDPLGEVRALLDEVSSAYRNRGLSRTIATEEAAKALGVTPRKAKAWLYNEAFSVSPEDHRTVKERMLDHLDEEAEHLAKRLDAVKRRREQLESGLWEKSLGQ
jgi:hypothetical protein